MERYAMYLRKSRADDPAESVAQTLAKHRQTLDRLAERRGLTVFRVYEEVVSGETIAARPEMRDLLSDVEAGSYRGVLCMDVDRLGRGALQDQGRILDAFRSSGTVILTPDRDYDLTDEDDEELTEFKAFFARREYQMIRKRMRRGVTATVEAGGYVSNPPYGYRACRIGKKPSLAVVEEEAELVRLAFRRYAAGVGPADIARELRALGAVSRRGAAWSRSAVRYLLTNPVYTGQILFRRHGQAVTATGLHPPIVTKELWEKAQKRRRSRQTGSRKTGQASHALTGVFRCARCGRRMQVSGRGAGQRLYCPTAGCVPSAPAETVEGELLRLLRPVLERSRPGGGDLAEERRAAKAAAETELRRLDHAGARLCDLLERGVYDEATYRRRWEELCRRKHDLTARLDAMTEITPPDGDTAWEQYPEACPAVRSVLWKDVLTAAVYDRTPTGKIRLSLADRAGGARCAVFR